MSFSSDVKAIKHHPALRAAAGELEIPFKDLIQGFNLRRVEYLSSKEPLYPCLCDSMPSRLKIGVAYAKKETIVWIGEECLRHFVAEYGAMHRTPAFLDQVYHLARGNFELNSLAILVYGFAHRVPHKEGPTKYIERDCLYTWIANRAVYLHAVASLESLREYTRLHPDQETGLPLIKDALEKGQLTEAEALEYETYLYTQILPLKRQERISVLNCKILGLHK